jgi:hypothetical protein
MRFLDTLTGWQQHPSVPHVVYRVTPTSSFLKLEAKCYQCGGTFEWQCLDRERAAWRINRWASFPCSLHR